MGKATYTLGGEPAILIKHCAGDLSVEGHHGNDVTAVSDTMIHSTQDHERLVIEECDDVLRLQVPCGATVTVEHADSDVRVDKVAALQLGSVDGDLTLHAIGTRAEVRRADGDVRVTGVAQLSLGTVDGDAYLDGVNGHLAVERVAGDATIRAAGAGFGPTHIDGSLLLDTTFAPDHEYRITAHDDAIVYVPDDADLTLHATVHGDVSGVEAAQSHGEIEATWGTGAAHLTLEVHGDLQVRRKSATPRPDRVAASPAGAGGAAQHTVATEKGAADDAPASPSDPVLAVLEALARGDITTEEADDLLTRRA